MTPHIGTYPSMAAFLILLSVPDPICPSVTVALPITAWYAGRKAVRMSCSVRRRP